MRGNADVPLNFVLKVVSRCNLACTYCYMYQKGDESWREQPRIMPESVYHVALDRIRRHCLSSGQRLVRLTFHGGEPCLSGLDRFEGWCRAATAALTDITSLVLSVQTNATLLDHRWIDLFRSYDVQVGVSIDGPKELHDAFRVDHRGRGSFDSVTQGISALRDGGIPIRVLCVVQLGADGLYIHRSLLSLGVTSLDYILPDFTHDTIQPVREIYGNTPAADYLLPILEYWWSSGSIEQRIRIFWSMARLILGGGSEVDTLGNPPFRYVFIDCDGSIEGLDVLRICGEGVAKTGLNVATNDFTDIAKVNELHSRAIFSGMPTPVGCYGCPEMTTCGGGYLPHRHSRDRGFNNPTVWCADILRLFGRMRELMKISTDETALRRKVLMELAEAQPRTEVSGFGSDDLFMPKVG